MAFILLSFLLGLCADGFESSIVLLEWNKQYGLLRELQSANSAVVKMRPGVHYDEPMTQTDLQQIQCIAATDPTWKRPAKTFTGNVIAGIVASLLTPLVLGIGNLIIEEGRKSAELVNWGVVGVGAVLALIITLNAVVVSRHTKNKKTLGTPLFLALQLGLGFLCTSLVVLLLLVANKPA